MERFRATPSTWEPSSWNVVDMTRRNQWGERAVVEPLVTEEEAIATARALNAAAQRNTDVPQA